MVELQIIFPKNCIFPSHTSPPRDSFGLQSIFFNGQKFNSTSTATCMCMAWNTDLPPQSSVLDRPSVRTTRSEAHYMHVSFHFRPVMQMRESLLSNAWKRPLLTSFSCVFESK